MYLNQDQQRRQNNTDESVQLLRQHLDFAESCSEGSAVRSGKRRSSSSDSQAGPSGGVNTWSQLLLLSAASTSGWSPELSLKLSGLKYELNLSLARQPVSDRCLQSVLPALTGNMNFTVL